jgi:6,7-dimethyl-8-ribityllumazine synthase
MIKSPFNLVDQKEKVESSNPVKNNSTDNTTTTTETEVKKVPGSLKMPLFLEQKPENKTSEIKTPGVLKMPFNTINSNTDTSNKVEKNESPTNKPITVPGTLKMPFSFSNEINNKEKNENEKELIKTPGVLKMPMIISNQPEKKESPSSKPIPGVLKMPFTTLPTQKDNNVVDLKNTLKVDSVIESSPSKKINPFQAVIIIKYH